MSDVKGFHLKDSNLKARLAAHNNGQSPHTSKYRPWRLITAVTFTDDQKAHAFEQYLKTGSGRAFAHKRIWKERSNVALASILEPPAPDIIVAH
jgi:putative endonuclease